MPMPERLHITILISSNLAFASVAEGGNGAILRCTEKAENGIDDEDAGTDDGSGNPDEIYNDGTDDSTPGSMSITWR